jgi:hypothetical protein
MEEWQLAAISSGTGTRQLQCGMEEGFREGEGKREVGAMAVHVTLGVPLVMLSATLASVARLWIASFV